MTRNAPRPRMRWLALPALVAAVFLVAAPGCGGDDDDGGSRPTTADDGEADLAALTGEYEEFEGYVKYTAHGFPEDDLLESMAIYQEGDNSRVDIDSAEGVVTVIDTADASYVCTENQCLQYPTGDTGGIGSLFTSLIDPSTIEDQFGGVDYDVSKEEIAGMEATCFSAGGNEVCFAQGGLLLRVTFAEGIGSGTLEAVETGSEIPDDAFEPPFDVVDLEELGG